MKFFREIEPGIFMSTGSLRTEEDGRGWTQDYGALLAHGTPFVVVANVKDRPQPPAGKPIILWMKAHHDELALLVNLTIFVAEIGVEHFDLEQNLSKRAEGFPYPVAVAAGEPEAVAEARIALDRSISV